VISDMSSTTTKKTNKTIKKTDTKNNG
jgi:hypothetical protein